MQIKSASELQEHDHAGAKLLLTHYGHREPGGAAAIDLLDAVNGWPERPPVIVFCKPGEHADGNRERVLRRGAYELATDWGELFQLIEHLFGRRVGREA